MGSIVTRAQLAVILALVVACAVALFWHGCRVKPVAVNSADWPPREMASYTVGKASFFTDKMGAWGPLDVAGGLYVACWHLARGTPVEFRAEGRCCTAIVADRGPAKWLVRRGRLYDCSPRLFDSLFGGLERGVGRVAARVLTEEAK